MWHPSSKIFYTILLCFSALLSKAQDEWPSPEVEQMYKDARELHTQGKLKEAIVIYSRAIRLAPNVLVLQRDLGQAYYFTGNYAGAEGTLEPIIKSGTADEQSYQIMANSLLALKENKKAKTTLEKGIERYPHSGMLYHELGKLYEEDEDKKTALKTWLTGIEADPAYHINYYEAARTYMATDKLVWAVLYGEMFINIEQQTPRANETRGMLISAYRRIFNALADGELPKYGSKKEQETTNSFESAVYNTFLKLSPVVSDGFNTENLIMLRTRFMMEWTRQFAATYPFTLFKREDDMLRTGYFDIYNQWLFGKAGNTQEYDAWKKFHAEAMPNFEIWLKQHPFQPVAGDFYNDKNVDNIFPKKKKQKD